MYILSASDKTVQDLKNAQKVAKCIPDRIQKLESNPRSIAKPTNDPKLTEYYANAGRYDILFNIDEEKEIVEILNVVQGPYLHKVLTGRIPYATRNN